MKALIVSIITITTLPVYAKDLAPFDDTFYKEVKEYNDAAVVDKDLKVTYLTKLLDQQQKSYDEKITFLETELRKTKDRLIEKSMNQEKVEEMMKEKYSAEALHLKKELAYTTKSLLDYQRQIEKMKPNEDLKNMIKLNTELASELRRSEDQIAIIQLKGIESMPSVYPGNGAGTRMPASVPGK